MNRMDDTFKCFGKTNRNYFYKFLLNLHNDITPYMRGLRL
jgi:hypothetical protein